MNRATRARRAYIRGARRACASTKRAPMFCEDDARRVRAHSRKPQLPRETNKDAWNVFNKNKHQDTA